MEALLLGLSAVGLSTAVVFGYLVFIWWLDRYEREPFWLVLVAFLWGGIGGTALGCIVSLTMGFSLQAVIPAIYSELFVIVVTAPFAEEVTKGLIFVVLFFTVHLDNETDGLIYGAAAGLGFAVVENMLYFVATAAAGPEIFYATVVVRTLFTSLVHAISTAFLGYTIGYVRHRDLSPWLWMLPIVGFAIAVINHGLWNFLAFVSGSQLLDENMATQAIGLGMVFVFFMAVAIFVITQLSLMREQKVISDYLEDEARRGTLPESHAEIIPSWRTRRKRGWLPPGVPHEEYIQAATMLAFRRYQCDTAAEKYRHRYRDDIEDYRQKVQQLLSSARPPG